MIWNTLKRTSFTQSLKTKHRENKQEDKEEKKKGKDRGEIGGGGGGGGDYFIPVLLFFIIYTLSPGGIKVDCNVDFSGNHKLGSVLFI